VPWIHNQGLRRNAWRTAFDRPVALRWPNDVVELTIDHLPARKLAGVLIERTDNLALVGIGINVLHARADWPFELAGKAASLCELGSAWSRAHTAVQLVTSLDALLSQHPSSILQFWKDRDALTGRYRTFEHNNQRFAGTIKSIDPTNHILLQLDDGTTISLPALSTSLVHEP
jgi:biotin-(acetyl-CoA carboxylase) ligase